MTIELNIDRLGVMTDKEFASATKDELLNEINFRRGQVIGLDMKVKELEEKFAMALEYQKEVDAQLVANLRPYIDTNVDETITFGGRREEYVTYSYTYHVNPAEAIRSQ